FGWSTSTIGASLAVVGAIMAIAQAVIPRMLIPRLGERGTALLGIGVGAASYAGYGLATASWMMFALLAAWFFPSIVLPTTNAMMSHRVAPDAQGELQGAVAGLFSIASITGPLLMTHVFGYFTSSRAPVHLPGAAFLTASLLAWGCF